MYERYEVSAGLAGDSRATEQVPASEKIVVKSALATMGTPESFRRHYAGQARAAHCGDAR
jgi:hypothetical protein